MEVWPTYRYGVFGPDEEATIEDAISTSRAAGTEVTIKWPGGASIGSLLYRLRTSKFDIEKVQQGWWRFLNPKDHSWSVLIQYSLDNPMDKGPLLGDPSGAQQRWVFPDPAPTVNRLKNKLLK